MFESFARNSIPTFKIPGFFRISIAPPTMIVIAMMELSAVKPRCIDVINYI